MQYLRYRTFFSSIAAVVALSSAAHAQDASGPTIAPHARSVPPGFVPDAVYLKNGGLLRGAVIESAPGDHVQIALPNGEVRYLPWAEVERVTVGAAPGAAPAPAAPAPPPEKVGPT